MTPNRQYLVFAKFYAGAKVFDLGLHARFFLKIFGKLFLLGKENHISSVTKLRFKNHRRDGTNFKGYFMNRQSVGICSCCPEVFLELFPIIFWILPFKILIPTVEIYNRNSTRVPSSHISHFVLIPTYVGPNASPLGNILYNQGSIVDVEYR